MKHFLNVSLVSLGMLLAPLGSVYGSSEEFDSLSERRQALVTELSVLEHTAQSRAVVAKATELRKELADLDAQVVPSAAPAPSVVVLPKAPSVGDWTRTFALDSGLVFVHAPDGVQLKMGGLNMSMGGGYKFGAGSSLNGVRASADGELLTQMSLDQFRQEVLKHGKIVSEK